MFGAYGLSAIKERRSKQISDWMGCKERTIKNKLSYSYRCGKGISDNTNIVSTGDMQVIIKGYVFWYMYAGLCLVFLAALYFDFIKPLLIKIR